MTKLKFMDILNAAVCEIYGERALELVTLFSKLNIKGQETVVEQAKICAAIPDKYLKSMRFAETENSNQ